MCREKCENGRGKITILRTKEYSFFWLENVHIPTKNVWVRVRVCKNVNEHVYEHVYIHVCFPITACDFLCANGHLCPVAYAGNRSSVALSPNSPPPPPPSVALPPVVLPAAAAPPPYTTSIPHACLPPTHSLVIVSDSQDMSGVESSPYTFVANEDHTFSCAPGICI